MLVLSRKVGQSILVGNDLVLQIVKVQGGRVKVAIQAPESVRIRRGELGPMTCEIELDGEDDEEEESAVEMSATGCL